MVWALGAGVGLIYARHWTSLPSADMVTAGSSAPGAVSAAATNAPALLPVEVWKVLQGHSARRTGGAANGAADRLRLAGTYSFEGGNGQPARKAIVDDPSQRQQFIVGEGERIGEMTVARIYHDHVTLQGPGGMRDVWIEFASRVPVQVTTGSNQTAAAAASATNRFGCVQVQENRWQFSRKPLLDYYQELLEEPDRMVAIFDTMKPVRDERNKITGYVVGIEGEKEFFDAAGLKQGDIVRMVNSVPMTSRKRAEFFIDEFLKDNMSAVVLEVERGGKMVKQVYQMRQ